MGKVRIINAGILGALAGVLFLILMRSLRAGYFNPELILGSFFSRVLSPDSWVFGVCLILLAGAAAARLYAKIFSVCKNKSVSVMSAAVITALIHGAATGTMLGWIGFIHPLIRQGLLADPGYFALNHGFEETAGLFLCHLMYAVVLAWVWEDSFSKSAVVQRDQESKAAA